MYNCSDIYMFKGVSDKTGKEAKCGVYSCIFMDMNNLKSAIC